MSETSSTTVAGTDNIVPIYQPNARWTTWDLSELFLGGIGAGKYVAKVNDFVVKKETNEWWRVAALDETTWIPTLESLQPPNSASFSDTDMLLGVGPGTQSDTYRVYIDKSVTPYTLAVDARLVVCGSMVTKAIIFVGSELLGTSKAISAIYDQTGLMLGQAIPLELVAVNGNVPVMNGVTNPSVNLAVKTVPVCHTMEDLKDGEIVTAVFYSDKGSVVSKRQLLVENTAYIRSTDNSIKYVTSIALESPFISESDPTLIQYPLNVPLNGLNLVGVVTYSDGSTKRLPVDGTKFSIFGFEGYLSTIIGQKFKLVLKYTLADDEIVYGANTGDGMFITKQYNATTIKSDGAYTLKLFGYPVWIDELNGYRLEWFLYDLTRTKWYLVTPYVKFGSNTAGFNPLLYGTAQQLNVYLNIKDVNGIFSSYIHSQTLTITLLEPGTSDNDNWLVAFDPTQIPAYGSGVHATTTFTNQNLWTVNIGSGFTSKKDWLDALYYNTKPLTDSTREASVPEPNYFALVIGSDILEYPITEWNNTFTISNAVGDGGTLFVSFFYRTADNDIHLSMCGLPIHQAN